LAGNNRIGGEVSHLGVAPGEAVPACRFAQVD